MTNTTAPLVQTVHRFVLFPPTLDEMAKETALPMPANARVTFAQFHSHGVEIFVLKTLPAENVQRRFAVCRTGTEMPHAGNATFVATVGVPGMAALHVFELV